MIKNEDKKNITKDDIRIQIALSINQEMLDEKLIPYSVFKVAEEEILKRLSQNAYRYYNCIARNAGWIC